MSGRTIFLRSGKWRVYADPSSGSPVLELVEPANPWNKMRVRLSGGGSELTEAQLEQLARTPEVRLWTDEHQIPWRVTVVGPGTAYPFPLRERHLLYDSERAWAGIVRLEAELELGDLTADELREHRDRIADVAGRRRRFRPPPHVQKTLAARPQKPVPAPPSFRPALQPPAVPAPADVEDPAEVEEPERREIAASAENAPPPAGLYAESTEPSAPSEPPPLRVEPSGPSGDALAEPLPPAEEASEAAPPPVGTE